MMAAPQRINLAFIGSGNWARAYHFPALAHLIARPPEALQRIDLRLHAIYSLEPETARAVAARYGFGCVYPDLEALVEDEAVNAIAVAVTPSALLSIVERVIDKGVPLFSAKPPGPA
ncbi:MAG: Gfo/Idh/MocA family oxidoreductase [Anaerolineae bacterium]